MARSGGIAKRFSWRSAPGPGPASRARPGAEGVVWLDGEGVVRHVDPGWSDAFGYPPDALLGVFFFSYIHARDLAPVLREAAALLQHRQLAATWTFRFRTAGEAWRRCTVAAEPCDAGGAVGGGGLRLTARQR